MFTGFNEKLKGREVSINRLLESFEISTGRVNWHRPQISANIIFMVGFSLFVKTCLVC